MKFRTLKTAILVIAITLSTAKESSAQPTPTPGKSTVTQGPRKQLATIIFAGLGGAVLGLSTLSFYGRPQDYLSNIAVGFAIGVIGGTAYVTYKAASTPSEFYGDQPSATHPINFKDGERVTQLNLRWDF